MLRDIRLASHYSTNKFKSTRNHQLLSAMGFAPLFVTTGEFVYKDDILHRPVMDNGRITHDAPISHGMSGGPLLKIEGDGSIINVFGCITSGDDDDEKGCY